MYQIMILASEFYHFFLTRENPKISKIIKDLKNIKYERSN